MRARLRIQEPVFPCRPVDVGFLVAAVLALCLVNDLVESGFDRRAVRREFALERRPTFSAHRDT